MRHKDVSEGATDTSLRPDTSGAEPGGAPRGLAELYRRHAPDAVRLGYLLTGDPHVAQDLAQDAFTRVAGRLLHLRRPEAFGPYLRRTVVNLARTHFRRERAERRAFVRTGTGEPRARDPEVADRETLRHALRDLPERQRVAVVLRFYEDMTYDQIAEAMRCRPGTVGSLLTRAMQTLRSEMEDE
jgi:RNA polymerase sigma-70 factor (sigma-E family)